ncbi:hypothetical protein C3L33_12256, partial [Rhododendron williamsianum]
MQPERQQTLRINVNAKAKTFHFKFKAIAILPTTSKLFPFPIKLNLKLKLCPSLLQSKKSEPHFPFPRRGKSLKSKFLWILGKIRPRPSKNKATASDETSNLGHPDAHFLSTQLRHFPFEEEEEAEDEVAKDDIAKEEKIEASSSRAPVETDQSNFTEEVQEPAEPYLSILSFPEEERDAPSILDYTPTYQGFIRQKETPTVIAEKPEQQEEGKVEEVLEDSFGEIPDILLSSLQRPLQGKFRLPREEDTDEEGEEVEEMPPKDIIGELERRKKKKQEEAKAKAVAKSGPSAQGLITKTSQPPGAKVPPPSSPASKRPQSSMTQTKDALAKKRQKTMATGSGEGGGLGEKGKSISDPQRALGDDEIARVVPNSAHYLLPKDLELHHESILVPLHYPQADKLWFMSMSNRVLPFERAACGGARVSVGADAPDLKLLDMEPEDLVELSAQMMLANFRFGVTTR